MDEEGYYTFTAEGSSEIKILGSTFYGIAAHIAGLADGKVLIQRVTKTYPNAAHYPFAFRWLEVGQFMERQSDDGEPSGTAGKPLLLVLQQAQVFNAAIVAARYFGGKRLGTGRLFHAFFDCAAEAVSKAEKRLKHFTQTAVITFPYPLTSPVQRAVDEYQGIILSSAYTERVAFTIEIPKHRYLDFTRILIENTGGKVTISSQNK